MRFFVFLVFRLLPKPLSFYWLPRDALVKYAAIYQRYEMLAIRWLRARHWEMDDTYRDLLVGIKADEPLQETPGEVFVRHYPNFDQAHLSQHVRYWWDHLAAMAGNTVVETPGEVFGRLHNQTKAGLQPFFQQASDALDKAGL